MAVEEVPHLKTYNEKQMCAATRFSIFETSATVAAGKIYRRIFLLEYIAPGSYGKTLKDDSAFLHTINGGELDDELEEKLIAIGERAVEAERAFEARETAKDAMRPPPLLLPVNDGFTDGLNIYTSMPPGFDMHVSSPKILEAIVAALRKSEVF